MYETNRVDFMDTKQSKKKGVTELQLKDEEG